ncbi:hypothetical protein BGZ65_011259 [Modicella reniformis]|uniref:Uncharacterized protein n=1 Tax=Modicella reniformis TaxID=1440133 RepID=A0A9P6M3C9_9FUNG|nr:hypothetical protein BGZ65_011259 [Modicella reniformis]
MDDVQDPGTLKEKFFAEHQLMREQLNLAGLFGLELQQSLEMAQRAERQSYAQIQALQDENMVLQARVLRSQELSELQAGSEDEVRDLTSENEGLQKELDGCRRELKMFRKDLDNLVEQMADMGTEVVDAKNKVSVYSRRLTEVEQELNSTQELNENLQEQLHTSLEKQKQMQTTTAQVMKNMQTELVKVVSDSGTIRSTLVELETRQDKCEGTVVEMISNTKEYAQLLEEAQTTIQTLRTESDMEGRGWTNHHSSLGSDWNQPATLSPKQTQQPSTLAMEDPELNHPDFPADEMDPQAWNGNEQVATCGMSLGMELGLGVSIMSVETETTDTDTQVKENDFSSSPPPPSALEHHQSPKQLTPAPPSPQAPVAEVQHKETQTLMPPPQQQLTSPAPRNTRKFSVHSLPQEFQQQLEEQTINSSTTLGQTRPPWNPSVALELSIANPRHRSRSATRGPSATQGPSSSSQSGSRSPSQASQYNALGTSAPTSSSLLSAMKKSKTLNTMPFLHASPQLSPFASSSSLLDPIPAYSGRRGGRSTVSGTNSTSSTSSTSSSNIKNSQSRPRSRTTAATVENTTPGIKGSHSFSNTTSLSGTIKGAKSSASTTASVDNKSATRLRGLSGGMTGSQSHAGLPAESTLKGATQQHHHYQQQRPPGHKTVTKEPTTPSKLTEALTAGTGRTTPRSSRPNSLTPSPRGGSSASMSSPPQSPIPQSPPASNKPKPIMGGSLGSGSGSGPITASLPVSSSSEPAATTMGGAPLTGASADR